MAPYAGRIKLCVLDTAGVVCDGPQNLRHMFPGDDLKGCKAPVIPFSKVLMNHNITVDWATIRKPMGVFKRTHLQMLLEDPKVAAPFQNEYGHPWTEQDLDALFEEFVPLLTR